MGNINRELPKGYEYTDKKCPSCGDRLINCLGVAVECENSFFLNENKKCDYVLCSG